MACQGLIVTRNGVVPLKVLKPGAKMTVRLHAGTFRWRLGPIESVALWCFGNIPFFRGFEG
jgi:hypothetical protein